MGYRKTTYLKLHSVSVCSSLYPACMQVFSVSRIRSSCEIHLQKIAVRVLKLARTYAKFCEEHDGVVEFWIE